MALSLTRIMKILSDESLIDTSILSHISKQQRTVFAKDDEHVKVKVNDMFCFFFKLINCYAKYLFVSRFVKSRYEIMLRCWQDDPEARPTFIDLRNQLESMETCHKVNFLLSLIIYNVVT